MEMKRVVGALAVAAWLGLVPAAHAESYAEDFGLGMAAVGVNILYIPAKFTYATLGGLTGGFAYLLTGFNGEVADRVWTPSLGGHYLVTPAHLRGDEILYFSGVVDDAEEYEDYEEYPSYDDSLVPGTSEPEIIPQPAPGTLGEPAPLVSPPAIQYD